MDECGFSKHILHVNGPAPFARLCVGWHQEGVCRGVALSQGGEGGAAAAGGEARSHGGRRRERLASSGQGRRRHRHWHGH